MKFFRDRTGKLPIFIIIIAVVVIAGGAGAYVFLGKGKSSKHEKKPEVHSWSIGEFTVNLADKDTSRYLQLSMELEVEGGKAKGGGGHGGGDADPETAKVRDAIILVLSSRRYAELLNEKGKTKLKEDLKDALNEVLAERKVVQIYFTSFAMQ